MQNRKRNRLINFDYRQHETYFVTICVDKRKPFFGEIQKDEMILNEYGRIILNQWLWLEKQYEYVIMDEFVVMPDHFHGILGISNLLQHHNVTGHDLSLQKIKIKSLSQLIGAFKTTSSKKLHENGIAEFKWQRSFYERIVRSEKELEKIRSYIFYNPIMWKWEKNDPQNLDLNNL